mgnify:CR=1 FL=1
MKFPEHKAGLYLNHNEHLTSYSTVEGFIRDEYYDAKDFISQDQMKKAIETNQCWCLQWYPDTPVGLCRLLAADLDQLLDAVKGKK